MLFGPAITTMTSSTGTGESNPGWPFTLPVATGPEQQLSLVEF